MIRRICLAFFPLLLTATPALAQPSHSLVAGAQPPPSLSAGAQPAKNPIKDAHESWNANSEGGQAKEAPSSKAKPKPEPKPKPKPEPTPGPCPVKALCPPEVN